MFGDNEDFNLKSLVLPIDTGSHPHKDLGLPHKYPKNHVIYSSVRPYLEVVFF